LKRTARRGATRGDSRRRLRKIVVVKKVKYFETEFTRKSFRKLLSLGDGRIHLPKVQATELILRRIAVRTDCWRCEDGVAFSPAAEGTKSRKLVRVAIGSGDAGRVGDRHIRQSEYLARARINVAQCRTWGTLSRRLGSGAGVDKVCTGRIGN